MSFWVKRTAPGTIQIADLGLFFESGLERDLALSFSLQDLSQSADLAAAISTGSLIRITGSGGANIAASAAYDDGNLQAHIALPYAHHNHSNHSVINAITDAGSGVVISAAERSKLSGIAAGAQVNDTAAQIVTKINTLSQPVSLNVLQVGTATAAQLRDRSTHTGTQTASTVSDFSTAVDARITLQKGAVSGLASLDASGKVPTAQIPATALPQVAVVIMYQATPPGATPANGDKYLIAPVGQGAWSGHDNEVATWNAGAWSFTAYQEGDEALETTAPGRSLVFNGNAWYVRTQATGDVTGPSSSVSGRVATFNGTTGKIIQDSGVALSSLVQTSRQVTAGAGLVGGGNLAGDITIDVQVLDGSIVVTGSGIQVGVLQSDAMHGDRGGGAQHSVATGSVAGFMSAADKTKLDGLSAPVFGTQYQYAESDGSSTNATALAVTKLTLTTPSLPAGDYQIEWYMEGSMNGSNQILTMSTVLDTINTIANMSTRESTANMWTPFGGNRQRTLTAGVHTVILTFQTGGAGTATVRRASLSIMRVA